MFQPDEYISPDQVRGSARTLNAGVLAHGWPSLDQARGKVVFLLDQRAAGASYLPGHPSLHGRVCFTNAVPGEDDAAFIERNDALPMTSRSWSRPVIWCVRVPMPT